MLIFDIETDGLYDDVTTIHCLVIKDYATGTVDRYRDKTLLDGITRLLRADKIVGHNSIKYDTAVIEKLYKEIKFNRAKVIDTLVLSRLIYADLSDYDSRLIALNKLDSKLYKSHSLEAWGQRLDYNKGSYDMSIEENRTQWSQEMEDYCVNDVELTYRLLKYFEAKNYSQDAIELEHKVAWITHDMQIRGVHFDIPAAEELYRSLLTEQAELEHKLQETFKPWVVEEDMGISKVSNKKTGRVKGERYIKKTTVIFNPGSRQHIADRLINVYNWKPKEFTPGGQPKVDETTIASLNYPEAQLLVRYLTIVKRIGMLADGKQAWLNTVNKNDSKIHGYINSNGAVSGRATHSYPNLAQVPAVDTAWGPECRALFTARPGYVLCGADLSGLELRCLAHFLHQFDDGAYVSTILSGDVHSHNQRAAGLDNRNQAKRFIYALIYGAGVKTLGETANTNPAGGKQLKEKFFKNIPALKKLIDGVAMFAEKNGYIPGLDKRRLMVRSSHSALNTLLQSAGALISKQALIIFEDLIKQNYLSAQLVLWVHDEFQIECKEEEAEDVGKLAIKSFELAGKHFGFRCPITGEYKLGRNWRETH